MASKPRILAFAGSLRANSYNKRLVRLAGAAAAEAGAEVSYLDLKDFPLPVFDEDLETAGGEPANARKIKDMMLASDGFLISAPEYNSSISAALKNAIDWASRTTGNEGPLACFTGKVIGLLSASPGALGGLRGLVVVRSLFGNIHALVVPEQIAIARAHEAFQEDGTLKDAKQQAAVEKIATRVVEVAARLKA